MADNIIELAYAAIIVVYSIFIFVIGIYGYSIIPTNCTNLTLRQAFRGLLTTGAVSVTAFAGYLMCRFMCTKTASDEPAVPWWLVGLISVVSLTNIICQAQIQEQLTSDSTCYTGSSDSFKQLNKIGIAVSAITLVFSAGLLVYKRVVERGEKKKLAEKGREILIEKLAEKDKKRAEAEEDEKREAERIRKEKIDKKREDEAQKEKDIEDKKEAATQARIDKQKREIEQTRKKARNLEQETDLRRQAKEAERQLHTAAQKSNPFAEDVEHEQELRSSGYRTARRYQSQYD